MAYETISALRVDLYECKTSPSEILQPLVPKNAINHAWIPQTMGAQVWVLYEFRTVQDRKSWEATLPGKVGRWLDRNLISNALTYGWHARNVNGFY